MIKTTSTLRASASLPAATVTLVSLCMCHHGKCGPGDTYCAETTTEADMMCACATTMQDAVTKLYKCVVVIIIKTEY